jgi:hypothetical protein
LLGLLLVLYIIYFSFSMKLSNPFSFKPKENETQSEIYDKYIFSNNKGLALLILTLIATFIIIWDLFLGRIVSKFYDSIDIEGFLNKQIGVSATLKFYQLKSWILILIVTVACIVYLAFDLEEPYNLISVFNIIFLLFICTLASEHPSRVSQLFKKKTFQCLTFFLLFYMKRFNGN